MLAGHSWLRQLPIRCFATHASRHFQLSLQLLMPAISSPFDSRFAMPFALRHSLFFRIAMPALFTFITTDFRHATDKLDWLPAD